MKNLVGIIIASLIMIVGVLVFLQYRDGTGTQQITSFQECADAGYPVMESFPERCRTPDGRTFVREISPTEHPPVDTPAQLDDLIIVENPLPNQMISSPLEVSGKARGTWYFEANFSMELVDANAASLGTAIAQAEGEWMTEQFVSFSSELVFNSPTTSTGELIIRNANPSGLPQNDKELRIPVRFSSED